MAMSAGPAEGDEEAVMSDINTTPLVDVMLVLLIIFLITVPVVIQTVQLKLPKVVNEPTVTKPENVSLSVRGAASGGCEVFWGLTKISDRDDLLNRGVAALRKEIDRQQALGIPPELPEVHIRGDVSTPYSCIGGVIYTMQRAGFVKVGFISEPPAGYTTPRL
jgi:biopolymer transport protein ExbD